MATTTPLPTADKLAKPPKTEDRKLAEKLATQYQRTWSSLSEVVQLEARLAGARLRARDRVKTYDALCEEAGGQGVLDVEVEAAAQES